MTNKTKMEEKKRRHKWKKFYYNGKYSSFETRALCTVCGCERTKPGMTYEYTTKEGEYSKGESPSCTVAP